MVSRKRSSTLTIAIFATATVAAFALAVGCVRIASYEFTVVGGSTHLAPHLRLAQAPSDAGGAPVVATFASAPHVTTTNAARRWNAKYKARSKAPGDGINAIQLWVPTATAKEDLPPPGPTEDETGPKSPAVMRSLVDTVEMRTYPRFSLPGPVCVIVLADGPNAVEYVKAIVDTWGDRSTLIVTDREDVYNLAATPSKIPNRQVVTTLINTSSFTRWKKDLYDEDTQRRPQDTILLPTFMWLAAVTSKFDSLTLQCRWFHFTSPRVYLRLDALEAELNSIPSHEAKAVGYPIPHPSLPVFRIKYGYSLSRAVLQREEPSSTLKILKHHMFTLLDDDIAISMYIKAIMHQRSYTEPNRVIAAQYPTLIDELVKKANFKRDLSLMPSCVVCAAVMSATSTEVMRVMHEQVKKLPFHGSDCPVDNSCVLVMIPGKRSVLGKMWYLDDDFQLLARYWAVAVHEGETFYSNRDSRRVTALLFRHSSVASEEDRAV